MLVLFIIYLPKSILGKILEFRTRRGGAVTITSSVAIVNDTTWSTIVATLGVRLLPRSANLLKL